MTNTTLLREKIENSGYKLRYIAKQLGITYAGFQKKLNNETEFKVSEVAILKELLKLTADEVQRIFFAIRVDLAATR